MLHNFVHWIYFEIFSKIDQELWYLHSFEENSNLTPTIDLTLTLTTGFLDLVTWPQVTLTYFFQGMCIKDAPSAMPNLTQEGGGASTHLTRRGLIWA